MGGLHNIDPNGLVVIGGGGHGLVVGEAAALAAIGVAGVMDDRADPPAACRGDHSMPWLGPIRPEQRPWILGIGDVLARRVILGRLASLLSRAASVIHPRAIVSPSAMIGRGVFVGPGAIIHSRARVGDHAIINSGAIVEHDCDIGENSHIAPGTVLGGAARVGKDSLVGLGSSVLPGIWIGDRCVVGAGALVLHNIPDGAVVVGLPARSIAPKPAARPSV
jgi:sugar O-acyltransferase (sialic acid O-acetyltransferase NeuD family)